MTEPDDWPERIQALPRWGNLPIPFFTFRDADGKPDFRVHDDVAHFRAMEERLCGVCGQKLRTDGKDTVFLLGPITLKERLTFQPAMHAGCCLWSMELCPWIALRDRDRSTREGKTRLVERDELPQKPDIVFMVYVRTYMIFNGNGSQYARIGRITRTRVFRYVDNRLVESFPSQAPDGRNG